MININYNGTNSNLRLAVNNVNNLLQQDYFYTGITEHTAFDMANITPGQLADLMSVSDINMEINLYYSIYPFSKAVSFDDIENPNVINLNKWTLARPVESICNTLMHHCVHALNAMYPRFSFGHGDNASDGKENTAPFWIAAFAQKLISDDSSVYEALDHDELCNIPFLQNFCTAPVNKRSIFAGAE